MIRPSRPTPVFLQALGKFTLFCVLAATLVLWVGLIHELLLRGLGTVVPAELVSIHETQNAGGAYSHQARYRYSIGGSTARTAESSISYSAWHRLREKFVQSGGEYGNSDYYADVDPVEQETVSRPRDGGAGREPLSIDVRAYTFGGMVYSRAVEHEWASLFLLIPAIFAPLLTALTAALHRLIVVLPLRRRWLYVNGATVSGLIAAARRVHTKHGVVLLVDFSYCPAGQRGLFVSTMVIRREEEFATAIPGKAAVVLYDPSHPKRCTVYDYGGYVWA